MEFFYAPLDTIDASSANLVRELVNCTTAQTVSPYIHAWMCIYARSLFMSIVHSLSRDRFVFSLYYWYLTVFSSGSFPCVIAPAFSTPSICSRFFHSLPIFMAAGAARCIKSSWSGKCRVSTQPPNALSSAAFERAGWRI